VASSKTAKKELVNELGQRKGDRREEIKPVEKDRRKGQRRRLIDPTTCERDYSQEEIDFMQAMDDYKRKSGRMFPTCSEILEVFKGMGYRRLTAEQLANEVCNEPAFAGDMPEDEEVLDEEALDEEALDAEFLSVSGC